MASEEMGAAQAGATVEGTFTFVGRTTARTSSKSSSLTIARPSGVVGGHVMIAALTPRLSPSGTITAPLGWTLIRRDKNIGGTSLSQALFYKVVSTLEPSSYTWRFSSNVGATGGITAFGGVDTVAPVAANSGLYSANASLIAAPSVTTGVDGTLVVGFFGNSSRTSMTPPTAMVEGYDTSNNASTSESASFVKSTAGPTGFQVARASSSANSAIGQVLALAPGAAPHLTLRRLRLRLRRLRLRLRLRPSAATASATTASAAASAATASAATAAAASASATAAATAARHRLRLAAPPISARAATSATSSRVSPPAGSAASTAAPIRGTSQSPSGTGRCRAHPASGRRSTATSGSRTRPTRSRSRTWT